MEMHWQSACCVQTHPPLETLRRSCYSTLFWKICLEDNVSKSWKYAPNNFLLKILISSETLSWCQCRLGYLVVDSYYLFALSLWKENVCNTEYESNYIFVLDIHLKYLRNNPLRNFKKLRKWVLWDICLQCFISWVSSLYRRDGNTSPILLCGYSLDNFRLCI